MKITSLVENTSKCELKARHALWKRRDLMFCRAWQLFHDTLSHKLFWEDELK